MSCSYYLNLYSFISRQQGCALKFSEEWVIWLKLVMRVSVVSIKILQDSLNSYPIAKKYFQTAYEKELYLSGYTPYNSDIHYYLGMIAVKEGRKMDAILAYMDLKNAYDGSGDISARKVELYKAIRKMDE